MKKTDTEYTYTYWITPSEKKEKATHEVTTKEESGSGIKGTASEKVESKNPAKKVGDKMKGLFNKGKSVFKKDKVGSDSKSDKTSSDKSNKTTKKKPVDDGSLPEK